jgi:signal transduction histidine kinase
MNPVTTTRSDTEPSTSTRGLTLAGLLAVFALAMLLGNEMGVVHRYPGVGAAVLFPPYALLTAALVAAPRRLWGWFILVAAVAHTVAGAAYWSLSWVLVADLANIARAITAAVLLRWVFGGVPRIDSMLELVQFVLSAVFVAPAVGATIGAANIVLHGASVSYWHPWTTWFMSNALTALTMLPACFGLLHALASRTTPRVERRQAGEAGFLAVLLGAASALAFHFRVTSQADFALLLYGPLPLLIWVAVRFGSAGAGSALTGLAIAAIWGAERDIVPLSGGGPDQHVLMLQLYVLLNALPVLCIAVSVDARFRTVQLYRSLLASLEDHVAVLDARGIVLEVNGSWRRFAASSSVGLSDRALEGDDYLARCDSAADATGGIPVIESNPPMRVAAGVRAVLEGQRRRFEIEYQHDVDGSREWFSLRVEALDRVDGGAVVTRSNVSARRRAQLQIEEQRRALSHLSRVGALGQLSGSLAHELRQPLTSILSNAQAAGRLLQRRPLDVDELNEIVHDIVTEDLRAAHVIDGLRAMFRRGEVRMESIDSAEVLREVLDLANAEMIARNVTATAILDPRLRPVLADRVQVKQVLLNLVLNACEAMSATPGGERKLVVRNRAAENNEVVLSVVDTGPGFPPLLVDRVFEAFVTTKADGLGLGLSIAHTIVDAHGGRIWAENNPGCGASVHCALLAAPAARLVSAPRDALRPSRARMATL